MSPHPFYTRRPQLASIRQLVEGHARFTYESDDLRRLFKAVNAGCAELYPEEDRGGWFSPFMFGGAALQHIPPHLMYAVYGIYADLARGQVDPVPFLSGPLSDLGTTAVQVDPSAQLSVMDSHGEAAPLTDILLLVPSSAPRKWILDTFGTPPLRPEVSVVGWHAGAESLFTAMSSGMLLLHPGSREALNPLYLQGAAEEGSYFTEPVMIDRAQRHCDRLVESIGVPREVVVWNYGLGKQVMDAYLKAFGPPPNLPAA